VLVAIVAGGEGVALVLTISREVVKVKTPVLFAILARVYGVGQKNARLQVEYLGML
jgi:hypothetical protein